jgi:LysM repeat protein
MVKIGSAVHTAHGLGTVTHTETVRGRTQYKVAGSGFAVWLDETKVATLGDVDESNSTTLPYDYEPQHPVEMYSQESTISPDDHDHYDVGERTQPTNSVTGESEEGGPYPGPAPHLFAHRGEGSQRTSAQECDYCGESGHNWDAHPEAVREVEADQRRQQGEEFPFGDHHEGEPVEDFDGYEHFAARTAAGAWGDLAEEPEGGAGHHAKGSAGHYQQYALRNGLNPASSFTADQYSREHGVSLEKAEGFSMKQGKGKHRMPPAPEMVLGNGEEVWDSEDWLETHPEEQFNDPREQARYEEWKAKHIGDQEFGERAINQYEPVYASYRPAGLSDKYIDIQAAADDIHDPAVQFRRDPIAFMHRKAYEAECEGMDPRVGQYMDLVNADTGIRTAAWNDVRTKALRLRREGKVYVTSSTPEAIYATVEGDHSVYDAIIVQGNALNIGGQSVTEWHCGCPWGKWAFKRKISYVGRFCSHAYATYLEMQARHTTGQGGVKQTPKRNRNKPWLNVPQYKKSAVEETTTRPERKYDVDGYGFDDHGGSGGPKTLKSQPERLSPDLYEVPMLGQEGTYRFDDGKGSMTNLDDNRKTTGPDQIMANRRTAGACSSCDEPMDDLAGYPGPGGDESAPRCLQCYENDPEVQYMTRNMDADTLAQMWGAPRKRRRAKVDKKWADDHNDLDDEKNPIVHFSMRKEALIYTADENLLEKLRDLSQDAHSDSDGHQRERNREVSEIVEELHDRGYDASQFVASLRRADLLDGTGGGGASGPYGLVPRPDEENESSSFGRGATPSASEQAKTPKTSPISPNMDGGDAAPAAQTVQQQSAPAPAAGGGGGGSDWNPNGITDPIGAGDYKIQQGDTLTSISDRSGVGVDDLMGGNSQITNKDLIFADDTLKIPGATPAAPAEGAAPAPAGDLPTGPQANAGPPPDNAAAATFAPVDPVPPASGILGRRRFFADENGALGAADGGAADDDEETKKPAATPTPAATPPAASTTADDSRSPAAGATDTKTPRGVPVPPPPPEQMTADNFGSTKSEPKTQRLEDRMPQPGQSSSTSGGGDIGSVMGQIGPALSGLSSGLAPLAGEIGSAVAPAISGLAGGLASGLGGLFSFGSAPDQPDHDAGLPAEDFGTSEEWINAHETGHREDVTDGEGDITNYTPPRQQPKQASYDDTDIVRQFQANIGNTALASVGGGGGYSDDAISQAAQGFLRTAGRVYSLAEQQELIDESHPQGARNLGGLDLRGTHYLEG